MQYQGRLSQHMSLRLPPSLRAELSRIAECEANPPASVARRLLAQGVQRELRRIAQQDTAAGGGDTPARVR